jgi:hypothetical protein
VTYCRFHNCGFGNRVRVLLNPGDGLEGWTSVVQCVVDQRNCKVVKGKRSRRGGEGEERRDMSSSSGLTFKLHPLVIVNISDHYTRIKAQSGSASPPPRVYGCVLGVQTGRTVEIFNSFELHYDATQNVLDRAFLESKQEQCKSHAVVLAKKTLKLGQAVIVCCQFFYRVRARVCKDL